MDDAGDIGGLPHRQGSPGRSRLGFLVAATMIVVPPATATAYPPAVVDLTAGVGGTVAWDENEDVYGMAAGGVSVTGAWALARQVSLGLRGSIAVTGVPMISHDGETVVALDPDDPSLHPVCVSYGCGSGRDAVAILGLSLLAAAESATGSLRFDLAIGVPIVASMPLGRAGLIPPGPLVSAGADYVVLVRSDSRIALRLQIDVLPTVRPGWSGQVYFLPMLGIVIRV